MSRPKYTYAVEVEYGADWRPIIDAETRDFCLGYLTAHRQCPGPRLAVRVVRSDGKLVDASGASERASLGMVAGWPTAEQYERAAKAALAQARDVRARAKQRADLSGPTGEDLAAKVAADLLSRGLDGGES